MRFQNATVVVEQVDDTNWILREPLEYAGAERTFHVPVGQGTDFASVPRVFVWFLPRYGRYTKAAILHDYLWRELASRGELSYVDADGLFHRAMRDLGVPFLQRWILWGAVRWGALVKRGGRQRWLGQLPKLLAISLVALPIVVPPAIVVGASLLVFNVVEALVWVPLKVVEVVKRARGARAKVANPPGITWKV